MAHIIREANGTNVQELNLSSNGRIAGTRDCANLLISELKTTWLESPNLRVLCINCTRDDASLAVVVPKCLSNAMCLRIR